MVYAVLPCITFLLLVLLASAALPFLALRDRSLARARKRSMYDKSAGQVRLLVLLVQFLLLVALGADWLADGLIASFVANSVSGTPLASVFHALILLLCAAVLLMTLGFLLARKPSSGASSSVSFASASSVATAFSGFFASLAACCGLVILWFFLRAGLPLLPVSAMPDPGLAGQASAVASASSLFSWAPLHDILAVFAMAIHGADRALLALFALECLTLAWATAQGLMLCWHVLRRRADDFGRDYYAFIIKSRSRRAAYAGACILPVSAVLLWLTPVFAIERLPALLPLDPGTAFWCLNVLGLCLPLAVLCWYLLVRAEAPLRRKFLMFLALPLLWGGVFSLLARLYI